MGWPRLTGLMSWNFPLVFLCKIKLYSQKGWGGDSTLPGMIPHGWGRGVLCTALPRSGSQPRGGRTASDAFDVCPAVVSAGCCSPNYPLGAGLRWVLCWRGGSCPGRACAGRGAPMRSHSAQESSAHRPGCSHPPQAVSCSPAGFITSRRGTKVFPKHLPWPPAEPVGSGRRVWVPTSNPKCGAGDLLVVPLGWEGTGAHPVSLPG